MALTIVPTLYQNWITNEVTTYNNVISQGFVKVDTTDLISDSRVRIPKLKSIASLSADSVRTAGNSLTTQAMTDYQELYPVLNRWDGLYNYGITAELQGNDALNQLKGQIAEKVNKDIQNTLVSYLTGAYVSALATTHKYDNTTGAGTGSFNYEAIAIASQSLLGEAMTNLDGLIMHSKIFADCVKNNLVTYTLGIGQNTLVTGQIPTIFGMKVWINDTFCAAETNSNGDTVYPTWIVGGQPFYLKWQKRLMYENYREPLSDKNNIIWHFSYALGIPGTSYTDATNNPTNTNLLTATITKTAENNKDIKLIKLITL